MNSKPKTKNSKLVSALLAWFDANARDLPWRRTRDPYAIWVSEIMLQQTQVKTVIPFWERWMHELPTIEAAAKAPSAKIHKLWEGLGYYTRVRNLQKAAQQIVAQQNPGRRRGDESPAENKLETPHVVAYKFPEKFDDVLALPGIGRYTAGAICSIAFNQPTPILDGNVIRVLTRIFGIAENPKQKAANAKLWKLAGELVTQAARLNSSRSRQRQEVPAIKSAIGNRQSATSSSFLASAAGILGSCSALNQSLMELGALVCTPRSPQCGTCPVKKLCGAFKESRVEEWPNLGKRETATTRRFVAFVIENDGKFLVRQRPAGVVNAHLWEFPTVEIGAGNCEPEQVFAECHALRGADLHSVRLTPLCTIKHSITRYRITLEAFRVRLEAQSGTEVNRLQKLDIRFDGGRKSWLPLTKLDALALTGAHRKVFERLIQSGATARARRRPDA